MYRRTPRADVQCLTQVLAGLEFPAAKWQLIMYAEEYGADAATRAELWSLPTGSYPDLPRVLAALGLINPPTLLRPGHRREPAGHGHSRRVARRRVAPAPDAAAPAVVPTPRLPPDAAALT